MARSMKGYQSKAPSRAEAALEWLELHVKEATWGAVAVLVVVGGIFFYQKSQAAQAHNAWAALDEAAQSLPMIAQGNPGNLPLAQSQLEKLVRRYESTSAGKVGLMLLAQVHYQKGEYQQGIDALKPLTDGDDRYFTAGAINLAAAGFEQLHKYPEAAANYQRAAAKARLETDRASYLLSAARVLNLAWKREEAKAIWRQLAADPTAAGAPEARVRLGELAAAGI